MSDRLSTTPGHQQSLELNKKLNVSFVPGTGDQLVLSFRGIGLETNGRPEEFWATISQNGRNHMMFVADLTQSWFNTRGLMRNVILHIRKVVDLLAPERIFAVGNSMGGYAACVFAKFIPIDGVLAICPQMTLDPALIEDPRWDKYAKPVRNFRAPAIPDCLQDRTRYTFIHGARGYEGFQAAATPIQANLRQFIFRKQFHAVVKSLKEQELLRPIISALLDGKNIHAERLIRSAGGELRDPKWMPYRPLGRHPGTSPSVEENLS